MAGKGLYMIILFFIVPLKQIIAQPHTTIWDDIKDDAIHSFNVGIGLVKSPFTASSSDWQRIGIATAGTGMLFLIDQEIKDFAQSNQNKNNNWIFGIDEYFNKEYVAAVTSGLYLSGLITRQTELRRTGLYAMEAVVYSAAITAILKRAIGRSRPYTIDDHTTFRLFSGGRSSYRSMPSGHATGAFSFCTVMAKSIDNNYWKTFWYGTAVLVGSARIYHNRHWLSDTALGGFIGYSTASYVVHFDENKTEREIAIKGYSIQPYVKASELGLMIHF